MDNKKIALLIAFAVIIIGLGYLLFYEYSRHQCVPFVQDAVPLIEKMPKGEIFYSSDLEYRCSWNYRKIILLIAAGVIGFIISSNVLKKHKNPV